MDCSLPGSSVPGFSYARILEGVAIFFPGDLPIPRIEPVSPVATVLAGRFFTIEPLGSPSADNELHQNTPLCNLKH